MRTFAAANTKEIAKTTARKMADSAVADAVTALKSEGLTDDLHAPFVARVLMHATKSAVANPPCLPNGELDVDKMKEQLGSDIASAKDLIKTCGNRKFNAFYADHFIKTLFNEDGTRNLATVDDLKNPRALQEEVGRENCKHAFTRNGVTPEEAGVSLSTSAYGIHKALEDYRRICDQAVQESGMDEHLEGGDENTPFRDFVSRLLLAKFSRPQLRNVQLALEGKETGFVVGLYNRIGLQKYSAPKMNHNDRNSVSIEAQGRIMTMTEMKCVIDGLLGDEDEDICQKPPKGAAIPEGLPFALLDDICEFCEVSKDHRPE